MTIRREHFILISVRKVRAVMCVQPFVHIIIAIANILIYTSRQSPLYGVMTN